MYWWLGVSISTIYSRSRTQSYDDQGSAKLFGSNLGLRSNGQDQVFFIVLRSMIARDQAIQVEANH